jgi:hypothetical protein
LPEVYLKVEILPHVVVRLDVLDKAAVARFANLIEEKAVDAADEAPPRDVPVRV